MPRGELVVTLKCKVMMLGPLLWAVKIVSPPMGGQRRWVAGVLWWRLV